MSRHTVPTCRLSVVGAVHRLEELAWPAVERLRDEGCLVLLLSGPVEQHGPHLPLGTDLFQAGRVLQEIATMVAAAGRHVLVAPAISYTSAVLSRTYPGSVSVRKAHLVPYFADVLCSFADNGLREVAVVSQHVDPPHVLAWEEACRLAGERSDSRAIEGYERFVLDDLRSGALREILGEAAQADTHAGAFETSAMLAIRPDLVAGWAELESVPLELDGDLRAARDFRQLGKGLGYGGHPALASARAGEQLMRRYASQYGAAILDHLSGQDVWPRLSVAALFPG